MGVLTTVTVLFPSNALTLFNILLFVSSLRHDGGVSQDDYGMIMKTMAGEREFTQVFIKHKLFRKPDGGPPTAARQGATAHRAQDDGGGATTCPRHQPHAERHGQSKGKPRRCEF